VQPSPSFLQTTASPPTISIIRYPPTCLLMPAVARLPRAQDGNLGGALVPLPLERPPLLRKGRKMRKKLVKLKGSELPHNNHLLLLHPLQFRSVVPRPLGGGCLQGPGLALLPYGFLLQFFLQEDEGAERKPERTSPSPPTQTPHQEAAPRASKGAQTG
jgi:hypothetical protein